MISQRLADLESKIRSRPEILARYQGSPWSFTNGGCYSYALMFQAIHGGEFVVWEGGYKLETIYHAGVLIGEEVYDATGKVPDAFYLPEEYKEWTPRMSTQQEIENSQDEHVPLTYKELCALANIIADIEL